MADSNNLEQVGAVAGAASEEEYSVPVEGLEGAIADGVTRAGTNGYHASAHADGEGSEDEDDEDLEDGAYGDHGVDSEAATALHGMRMAAPPANPPRSTSELSQEEKARLREKLKKKNFDVAPTGESSKRKHGARSLAPNETEEEEKKRIRKEKNREAAARCRNKRRITLEMLEKECSDMQGEIGQLEDQLQQVQNEIRAMEASLKDHSCLFAKA